jgi:excisionase family DNA binding protein
MVKDKMVRPEYQKIFNTLKLIESLLNNIQKNKNGSILTVKEAAQYLRCSTSKVRDLMRSGKLRFYRLESSERSTILIKREDIERMLR